MSDIRHQVTKDPHTKDFVVISALTTPDFRVLVETETLPFVEAIHLASDVLQQRVEGLVRLNEERIRQRI